jgi:hypothetical protein
MISVTASEESVQVTIPRADLSPERLETFLNLLRLETLSQDNALTPEAADNIADEIKASWWSQNKHRFVSGDFK